MKKELVILLLLLCLVIGCSKSKEADKELDKVTNLPSLQGGSIAIYTGDSSAVKTNSISKLSNFANKSIGTFAQNFAEATVFIDNIEITKNGTEWISIISAPLEANLKEGEYIGLVTSVNIPVGQYHGVRITFKPKVIYKKIYPVFGSNQYFSNVDIPFNTKPINMRLGQNRGNYLDFFEAAILNPVLSTYDGTLAAFDIEENIKTYLVLDIAPNYEGSYNYMTNENKIVGWNLNVFVRATRFLN